VVADRAQDKHVAAGRVIRRLVKGKPGTIRVL
jgi:hypothetical protein